MKPAARVSCSCRQNTQLNENAAAQVAQRCEHPPQLDKICAGERCEWRVTERCNALFIDDCTADKDQIGMEVDEVNHLDGIGDNHGGDHAPGRLDLGD